MQIINKQFQDQVCLYGDYSYSLQRAFMQGYIFGKWSTLLDELIAANADIDIGGSNLQVRGITREMLLKLVQTFGGKWNKRASGYEDGKLVYSQEYSDGNMQFNIEISSDPPPSCKVIEEVVEIPAHKALRKRVICKDDAPDEVPTAASDSGASGENEVEVAND